MALSEIFSNISKDLREAPLIGAQSMKANIELQNLIEEQNARKGLQELFKKNAAPTVSEIGSIAPGMVPDYLKNQFANQAAIQGMQKNAMEMQKMHFENNARVFGPIAEQAMIDRQNGDPQWETKYNVNMGNAARYIVESGGKLPQNFDAELHKPELILRNANTILGQQSSYFKNQQELEMERSKRIIPPAMPADLYYPTKSRTELDPVTHAPVTIPGQPGLGAGNVQPNYVKIAPTQQDLDQLIEMQKASNNPAEKAQIGTYIADIQKQLGDRSPPPVATGVTPQQLGEIEAKKSYGRKAGEAKATEEIQHEKMETAFDEKELTNLVNQATPGGVAAYGTKAAELATISTPWSKADTKLGIISSALTAAVPRFEGPQSDADRAAYKSAAGDLGNPSKTRGDKIEAIKEMKRLMDKYNIKHGRPIEQTSTSVDKAKSHADILDLAKKGEITREQAIKMFDELEAQ